MIRLLQAVHIRVTMSIVKYFELETPIKLDSGKNNISIRVMVGFLDLGAYLERRFAGLHEVGVSCNGEDSDDLTMGLLKIFMDFLSIESEGELETPDYLQVATVIYALWLFFYNINIVS